MTDSVRPMLQLTKKKKKRKKKGSIDSNIMIRYSLANQSRSIVSAFCIIVAWLLTVTEALPFHPLPPHKGIVHGSHITHYEAAFYDVAALKRNRNRNRRDVANTIEDRSLVLQIKTFDRVWTIRLVRDENLFAKNATFEGTDGIIKFDTRHSYFGNVIEDDTAMVEGIVTRDGLFDGTITTELEEYYIEPTSRYLSGNEDTSPIYHSIAYRVSDVSTRSLPKICASRRLYERSIDSNITETTRPRYRRRIEKRATVDPRKTTCMLYLQADHQFFSRYGTEESCIEVMTRHVQKVNSIYKHTDFNQDGRPDNISFMIKRIKVHNEKALKDPNYRFPGNYGVEKYLEVFSEEDYDAFCLAYMFTYRDFEMGTLGLAWTGDLKNAGGVCEKNGHYRGSMKSLNTGIVTLLNYGKHVPPAVSHVTLAHEIGHNFGSPHDPEQCTPGGEDGNFIMFARATSGDKKNNNRFSPCSLNAINPVLNTKARSPKGCFTEPQASLCGNGVVEEGEECDCGWEEDCDDTCCFPQRRYPPAEETPCTLTPKAVCSPSQGPCCTETCRLKFGDKCRDDNGCRDASFCDGRSPYCPPSINKPNKTICNREFVCFMGECTGSICLAYGLESCQCIPGPNDQPTKACELCCRLPGERQPCLSSFDWNSSPYDIPDLFSKPGTPCNDYNGYCDVFQKCREVDPNGPLATLRKLLLSEESIASFRRLMLEHWYLTALIVLGAFSVLMIATRLLAKQSNRKLKSVTIIHSSTTETVRLPPEGTEGVTVHPALVREKLPLSKKVREKRRRRKRNEHKRGKKSQLLRTKKSSTVNELDKKKRKPQTTTAVQVGGVVTKKEVIDYSAMQTDKKSDRAHDPKDKVSSWLLASSQWGRDDELPKSKSTPVELANAIVGARVQNSKRPTPPLTNNPKKDRARLQVFYKPPFRFNVKLKKPDNNKATTTAQPARTNVQRDKVLRTAVLLKNNKRDKLRIGRARQIVPMGNQNEAADLSEIACSDSHTIPSDLEVLLSESEFLFNNT